MGRERVAFGGLLKCERVTAGCADARLFRRDVTFSEAPFGAMTTIDDLCLDLVSVLPEASQWM